MVVQSACHLVHRGMEMVRVIALDGVVVDNDIHPCKTENGKRET